MSSVENKGHIVRPDSAGMWLKHKYERQGMREFKKSKNQRKTTGKIT